MKFYKNTRHVVHAICAAMITSLAANVAFAHNGKAGEDSFVMSVEMQGSVNSMVEQCRVFKHGGLVRFSFASDYRLDFNVHHHGDFKTTFPAKIEDIASYQGQFLAEPEQSYCFMWQNRTFMDIHWQFDLHVDVTNISSATR